MKRTHSRSIAMTLGSVTVISAAAAFAQSSAAQLVPVAASRVFAPIGFDDNDEVEVVLDGYLADGCYRIDQPHVSIDEGTKSISITPMARRYDDASCIKSLVPYNQTVQLGVLPQGHYTVNVKDGLLSEVLDIKEATSAGPDDYLYAPIDEVTTGVSPTSGKIVATLSGRFTNSCMMWDDVKVIDTGKVVNVLPVMKMATTDCQAGEFPFTKSVTLPDSVSLARHLLHVRSLNGQAVNHLFYKVNNAPIQD